MQHEKMHLQHVHIHLTFSLVLRQKVLAKTLVVYFSTKLEQSGPKFSIDLACNRHASHSLRAYSRDGGNHPKTVVLKYQHIAKLEPIFSNLLRSKACFRFKHSPYTGYWLLLIGDTVLHFVLHRKN